MACNFMKLYPWALSFKNLPHNLAIILSSYLLCSQKDSFAIPITRKIHSVTWISMEDITSQWPPMSVSSLCTKPTTWPLQCYNWTGELVKFGSTSHCTSIEKDLKGLQRRHVSTIIITAELSCVTFYGFQGYFGCLHFFQWQSTGSYNLLAVKACSRILNMDDEHYRKLSSEYLRHPLLWLLNFYLTLKTEKQEVKLSN